MSIGKLDEAISAEVEKSMQAYEGVPRSVGLFSIRTANETIAEAKKRPNPEMLFDEFWFEGEVGCLFADTNAGKSILAVQIGHDIAKSQRVLYFDFELTDKQFQMRYTEEATQRVHEFPPNFYRIEVDRDEIGLDNFTGQIMDGIEAAAIQTEAKVLIIDNLTWLCNDDTKGDLAGRLMIQLIRLKKQLGLSLLILAHTPKRPLSMPITVNDLAGSKKLSNFFDSIFCIGKSYKAEDLRYLKQIKVRNCAKHYGADNVAVYRLDKVDSMLQFVFVEYSSEREHLHILTPEETEAQKERVKTLTEQGASVREISRETGLAKTSVNRIQHQ